MQIFTADDGSLYTKTPTATSLTTRSAPAGCTAQTSVRPAFTKYRRTTIIAGRYNSMVTYRDDLDTFFKTGITPPATAPVLVASGGGGVIDGDIIGYVTYVHKSGTAVILESAPSPASAVITASTATTISWTSIVGTSTDTRVTHVRLYRQDNDLAPRLVVELTLGTVSYTDTTPQLSLGAEMQIDGGVPPYCRYVATYKHRVYYAGDINFPDRVWFSNAEDPENVDALSFFKTTSGEAVTGLGVSADSLIIFTPNTTDILRDFGEDDLSIRQGSPSIGCISHWSIVNIHDRLWFASQSGIYLYDGTFRFITADNRSFWKDDYAAHRAEYESCFAADDRPESCYILSIPFSDHTFRWVGYYLPFDPDVGGGGESQPWWFFDYRTRVDKALGLLTYGGIRFRLYVGSDDGRLRQEDVDSDASDDSDSYNKALTIQTKLYLFDDPGGDSEEGKSLERLWSYVESESNAWTLKIYGGDESAGSQLVHNWKDDVAASALTTGGHTYVSKTVHPHVPEQVSGRGFIFQYTATSPVLMIWRGLGGNWTLGPAFRGQST